MRSRRLLVAAAVGLSLALPVPGSAGTVPLEGRVVPNPLTVDVVLGDAIVEQGESFAARATVSNAAGFALLDARLQLRSDGDLVIFGDSEVAVGPLPAGATQEVTWSVCAPEPGSFLILAAATALSPEGRSFAAESQSRLVEVVAGARVCGGFAFDGFYPPVDNPPIVNVTTAGATVPVKFSIGGDHGLAIFSSGYPASAAVTCDSRQPTDSLETTTTAGASSLTYDPRTDVYSYAWKTERRWAGTCRQLVLLLTDGTLHRAEFRFRQ